NDVRERRQLLRRARIDRDLVAITLKAIAPAANDRYRDAGQLAADLKAFKSGVRITARDYSLPAVLAHWIRRHRMFAITVAALVAFTVAGATLYGHSVASARDRADAAAAHAEQQRAIAAAERDHARLAQAS